MVAISRIIDYLFGDKLRILPATNANDIGAFASIKRSTSGAGLFILLNPEEFML